MSFLKITTGHKNQKMLTEAFIYAKISQALEDIFKVNFASFLEDYKKLSIICKNIGGNLKLTLKSSDIQFLSWLKSQNIDDLLLTELQKTEILGDNQTLKIIYKII